MPDDANPRFLTHHSYLESFARLGGLSTWPRFGTAIQELRTKAAAMAPDAAPPQIDTEQVHRSLRNAWSTELLLCLPAQWASDDEFVRLSNTWGVVQTYYVGYHATQALIVAKGRQRPPEHPKTQRQFADLWVDRPLDIPPWTFGVTANGPKNIPAGHRIDPSVHSWERCTSVNACTLAERAIRTTRQKAIEAATNRKREDKRKNRRDAWRVEERARLAAGKRPRIEPEHALPRLTEAEKTAVDASVRSHTMLHYLYRLRIGANYDDAAVFFDGPSRPDHSEDVQRNLVFLASGTLLLSELRVASLVGLPTLRRWGSEFVSSCIPSGHRSIGVAIRMPLW